MAAISKYSEARERWTWRNQVMKDGTGRTKILSDVKVQDKNGCAFFALVATLESNLRVQLRKNVSFSTSQMKNQYETSTTSLPQETKIMRLLQMIKDHGIFEEGTLRERDARKYRIIKYQAYNLNRLEDIRHAMWQLRNRGPLLAVINISKNYLDCRDSGVIYRFDPDCAVKIKSGAVETHAVCVVSFAVEAKEVPCLECQDSQGPHFGRGGFLVVDITSVVELYSIRMF